MNLRIKTSLAAAVFALSIAAPAFAAPLFPDVPENHWARDAVATLAAKGIVEGYPDGTFKGDRAATRWEVAMVVARLLAKMEHEHATFATKAELAELQKLVDALRSELDALGVRVTKLEDQVAKLDLRVSELERITFYGSVDSRLTAQSFRNSKDGQTGNNLAAFAGPGYINYDNAVGTLAGTNLNPLTNAAMPVVDMTNGVGLSNGTGFTMKAILGMRIRVTDDIDAGAEFAAYTSAGNSVVDALWGVSAPYSCNPFTADNGAANLGNRAFTRMTLDNFWVMHNPSGTKLTLGAYNDDMMDDILFAGQRNLGAFGNEYLDRFGFNLNGAHTFSDYGVLRWEVMGSRIADGSWTPVVYWNEGYTTDVIGVDVGFEFNGGQVKLNFMRAANEAQDGDVLAIGGIDGINTDYGIANLVSSLQWVNPAGYFSSQNPGGGAGYGVGSTIDDRPIPGWNPATDFGLGAFGPQSMFGYGISADYKWDIGESGNEIYAAGEYARTEYKSNKNSDYTSDGNAYRIEVGTNLLEGDLDLSLAYLNVDPNYDPFVNVNPTLNGQLVSNWCLPNLNGFNNMWSMHDTEAYPHNRKGIQFNGQWRFLERRGLVWAKASFLDQTETSLYDVRVAGAALAAGVPTNDVLGFAPGFMDPVFYGYAHPSVYGGGCNSFNAALAPLDDNRGKQNNWGAGVSYKWDAPRIKIDLGYENNNFKRDTNVAANLGGSQNYVNLTNDSIHVGLGWEANEQWTLRGGVDIASMHGHWDPAGIYNAYAISTADTGFKNIDTQQFIPYIGFDYDISANTQWNMDFRYYDTVDKVDATTYAGATVNSAAPLDGYTSHPFSWHGWQVTTQFKVKF